MWKRLYAAIRRGKLAATTSNRAPAYDHVASHYAAQRVARKHCLTPFRDPYFNLVRLGTSHKLDYVMGEAEAGHVGRP